jgi:hypothetical protein
MMMNIHVPDNIKEKWPNYEFTGKPIKLRDGKTYMRAYSKCFEKTHLYCFEDDWFWHDVEISGLPFNKTLT